MSVICIDPGVNNFGIAIYDGPIEKGVFQPPVVAYAEIVPAKVLKKTVFHRIEYLLKRLDEDVLQAYDVRHVFSEFPEVMGGLVGTAAMARGDILHLATFCGGVMGLVRSYRIPVTLLPVSMWKGNMPKDMVNKRIIEAFERAGLSHEAILSRNRSHDWDACGIGCYLMGELV